MFCCAIVTVAWCRTGCASAKEEALLVSPLPAIYRGILPFLVIYLVALALVTYVPAISGFGVWLLM